MGSFPEMLNDPKKHTMVLTQPIFRRHRWFPSKMTSEHRNSTQMTRHYPVLGSGSDWLRQISHAARPITGTTRI